MRTTNEIRESGSRSGLEFTFDETTTDAIYDAEGVRVHVGDELILEGPLADPIRGYNGRERVRVRKISDAGVRVYGRDGYTSYYRTLDAAKISDFARIYVEVDGEETPAGVVAGTPSQMPAAKSRVCDRNGTKLYGGDRVEQEGELGTVTISTVDWIRVDWDDDDVTEADASIGYLDVAIVGAARPRIRFNKGAGFTGKGPIGRAIVEALGAVDETDED